VVVGLFGKDNYPKVFDNCPMSRALAAGRKLSPEEKYLPGSTMEAPFVFRGVDVFLLTEYLMRQFT
jgi:hypothetical protein